MYSYLLKYFPKKVAGIIMYGWYVFLMLLLIKLAIDKVPAGEFRYMGW